MADANIDALRLAQSVSDADLADLRLPDYRLRLRQGRRSALAKACAATQGLRVHDALAGWGTDGLVLAALGCRVHMSERNPRVYSVLARRLQEEAPVDAGLTWQLEDARSKWLERNAFDVVYLDPMFAAHPKTARPSKHMQILATIADPVEDIQAWLDAARRVASWRVVLKRRANAPRIDHPDWSIDGRSVRFDVYKPIGKA